MAARPSNSSSSGCGFIFSVSALGSTYTFSSALYATAGEGASGKRRLAALSSAFWNSSKLILRSPGMSATTCHFCLASSPLSTRVKMASMSVTLMELSSSRQSRMRRWKPSVVISYTPFSSSGTTAPLPRGARRKRRPSPRNMRCSEYALKMSSSLALMDSTPSPFAALRIFFSRAMRSACFLASATSSDFLRMNNTASSPLVWRPITVAFLAYLGLLL
mmetsp:Transcript_10831/g.26459  ORF Transcript_10831/g.26459 Transcript_10831/m.26459 type:complete len:219 (+) Transcript_10831:839-1495(+)